MSFANLGFSFEGLERRLDEEARGDDLLHLGGFAGRAQVLDAGGEVEHRGRAAMACSAKNGSPSRRRWAASRRRSRRFLVRVSSLPERERRAHDVVVGENVAVVVVGDDSAFARARHCAVRVVRAGEQRPPRSAPDRTGQVIAP